jgi:hypothetical protein
MVLELVYGLMGSVPGRVGSGPLLSVTDSSNAPSARNQPKKQIKNKFVWKSLVFPREDRTPKNKQKTNPKTIPKTNGFPKICFFICFLGWFLAFYGVCPSACDGDYT